MAWSSIFMICSSRFLNRLSCSTFFTATCCARRRRAQRQWRGMQQGRTHTATTAADRRATGDHTDRTGRVRVSCLHGPVLYEPFTNCHSRAPSCPAVWACALARCGARAHAAMRPVAASAQVGAAPLRGVLHNTKPNIQAATHPRSPTTPPQGHSQQRPQQWPPAMCARAPSWPGRAGLNDGMDCARASCGTHLARLGDDGHVHRAKGARANRLVIDECPVGTLRWSRRTGRDRARALLLDGRGG